MNKLIIIIIMLAYQNTFSQNKVFISKVDSIVKQYVKKNNYIGVSIGFSCDSVRFTRNYGLSNVDKNIKVDSLTKFEIGSNSKLFVGLIAYDLVQKNKLKLNDTVGKYLTGLPNSVAKIRIDELLTHTSGLKSNPSNLLKYDDPTKEYTISLFDSYLKSINKVKRKGRYRYSNSGVILLSLVLEKITNQSIEKLLNDILNSFDMNNSDCKKYYNINNLAKGYSKKNKPTVNWQFNAFLPAGGVHATANDMSVFIEHFNNLNFKEISIPMYIDKKHKISYLFHLKNLSNGKFALFHSGNTSGFYSYIIMIPSLKVGVVVMVNKNENCVDLGVDLLNILIKNKKTLCTKKS